MGKDMNNFIQPHIHNPVPRNMHYSIETLFIKKGRLRIDFYDSQKNYLASRILQAFCGHGIEVYRKASTFRKGQINEWRNEFKKEHLLAFEKVAGNILEIFGYKK